MAKVIILNGPPGVGKDTIASRVWEKTSVYQIMSFKEPMFKLAAGMMTTSQFEEFMSRYNERDFKDLPIEWLNGLSPRGFMIWLSETVVKPVFGSRQFGYIAAESIPKYDDVIFSDGGFPDECRAIANLYFEVECYGDTGNLKVYDKHDVHIVRLHRDGFTFDGDSRNYIYLNGEFENVKEYDLVITDGKVSEAVDYVCKMTGVEI